MNKFYKSATASATRKRLFKLLLIVVLAVGVPLAVSSLFAGCDDVEEHYIRCDQCVCATGGCSAGECCDADHPIICEEKGMCYTSYSDCTNACPY